MSPQPQYPWSKPICSRCGGRAFVRLEEYGLWEHECANCAELWYRETPERIKEREEYERLVREESDFLYDEEEDSLP